VEGCGKHPAASIEMSLNTPQRLLNEYDVASSCSISVLTLRKWRGQKRGPQFVKIGVLVRYRPEDVDAWIEEQRSRSADLPEAAR
jgi:predicted DNA-binding transcriptional regulator AlpA